MSEYIIIGAGAIGGVLGAYLSKNHNNIIFIDENKEHVETINSTGLTINTNEGDINIDATAYDVTTFLSTRTKSIKRIILSVKAQDTEVALTPFLKFLDKDSFVISSQNGLTEDVISNIIGEERTIGCFVNIYADYLSPGSINYGGKGSLYLGELDGMKTDRLNSIKEDLSEWGEVIITDNIYGHKWSKMAYGSILATTALVDDKMSTILSNQSYTELFTKIAKEILIVASKENISLEKFEEWDPYCILNFDGKSDEVNDIFLKLVNRLKTYTKVKSGVWRDLAVKKKKTEMHSQLSPIFDLAEKHSLKLTLNRKALKLITEIENNKRKMSYENLDILKKLL